MKTGENWRKSDKNVSLWEPRLRCPAVKADGMRTVGLGFLDYTTCKIIAKTVP